MITVSDFIKTVDDYTKDNINHIKLMEWAKNQLYENIKNDMIFNLEALQCYPFLNLIAFRENDDEITHDQISEIKSNLLGMKYYNYLFITKLKTNHYDLNTIKEIFLKYKKNSRFTKKTYNTVKLLYSNLKQPINVYDLIYNTIISLIYGLPYSKNLDSDFCALNVSIDGDITDTALKKVTYLFSIYEGNEFLSLSLNYSDEKFFILIV